jgi:hypothetical protein
VRWKKPIHVKDRSSAGLSIEGAGLVARNIKLHVFLVDPFVPIHTVLFRIIVHRMVPPVEQGIGLCPIDRIAIIAPGIFLDETSGNIIDLTVPMQRVEYEKESGFVIVMFINS